MAGSLSLFVCLFVLVQPGTTTSFCVLSNILMIRLALEFRVILLVKLDIVKLDMGWSGVVREQQ
jgi:hypothetical protein